MDTRDAGRLGGLAKAANQTAAERSEEASRRNKARFAGMTKKEISDHMRRIRLAGLKRKTEEKSGD